MFFISTLFYFHFLKVVEESPRIFLKGINLFLCYELTSRVICSKLHLR